MGVIENLVNMREPAFASDLKGWIVDWNESAERLLGYTASDVIGRRCFETLDGKDVFGNRFCDACCAVRNMICRREAINQLRLNYRAASSDRINVSVSVSVVSGNAPSDYRVVHMLQPVGNLNANSRASVTDKHDQFLEFGDSTCESVYPEELTARETEVLQLLAAGLSTGEMTCRLSISEETIRTHVRNILKKLDAHSRLEAVSIAIRHQIL